MYNDDLNNDLLSQQFCNHQFNTIAREKHQHELDQAKVISEKFKKCKDLQNSPNLNSVTIAIQLTEDTIQNSNNNEDFNVENDKNNLNNNNNNVNSNNFIELKETIIPSILEDFPDELILEIFSYLSFEFATLCLVSKEWRRLAMDDKLCMKESIFLIKEKIYREFAFGNDKWAQNFGVDVVKDENNEEEWLSLPWDIARILESKCPIFPQKKIKHTHMLVRLPKTLNGGLTIKSLGMLVKDRFPKSNNAYRLITNLIVKELGDKSIDKSRWVLMTDILPESRNKSYGQQQKIVAELAEKSLISYEIPEILESVACIFSQYFNSNTHLFRDNPLTYTICKEKVNDIPIAVGGVNSTGLCVSECPHQRDYLGVAAVRKF